MLQIGSLIALSIRIYEADYNNDPWIEQSVFELLQIADSEFLPPLSSRGPGTPQENLDGVFRKELERWLLCAIDEEDSENPVLAGYMSYEDDHVSEKSNNGLPCRYVIRVIVRPEYRGNGITDALYARLAQLSKDVPGFGVRTWTTNHTHRKVLERCGFVKDGVIKDDRGPGIDSIYYWKPIA